MLNFNEWLRKSNSHSSKIDSDYDCLVETSAIPAYQFKEQYVVNWHDGPVEVLAIDFTNRVWYGVAGWAEQIDGKYHELWIFNEIMPTDRWSITRNSNALCEATYVAGDVKPTELLITLDGSGSPGNIASWIVKGDEVSNLLWGAWRDVKR